MNNRERPLFSSICIIGRCAFESGIGQTTYAACELLSRFYDVSIFPTEPNLRELSEILLPNGTRISVCKDLSEVKVAFYTDVLWNGAYDFNYTLIPSQALRIAHVAWDSDELLPQWAQIMNERLDFVLFMNKALEEVARKSGVQIGIGTLPLGIDIESLLSRTYRAPQPGRIKFLSVAAFHSRKGVETLVDAFLQSFGQNPEAELTIHSNLAIGSCLERIREKVRASSAKNVIISDQALSSQQKNDLIEACDVFVNCSKGEGFSIGPREALALGKALVITDVGGHRDLYPAPGVFVVPAGIAVPARYPEVDNLIAGRQFGATTKNVQIRLEEAFQFVVMGQPVRTAQARRELASEFSFSKLANDYARLVNFDLPLFRPQARGSKYTRWPEKFSEHQTAKLGIRNQRLPHVDRTIVQSHDGGFFSVFNTFMSHLVWDQRDTRCHMVLPDWNISRMMERNENKPFVSFCYGKPDDGNIWTKLFYPLFGLTADQMDDPAFLYDKGKLPQTHFNDHREPQLTYVHAYKLYKSGQFRRIRKQYHSVLKQHIRLLPDFQSELDTFVENNFRQRKFMIAAHIKHPSHVIEQPGGAIAYTENYVATIRSELEKRGIAFSSPDWGIFLATDQDRVVNHFKAEFGSRVSCYEDVRRTREHEDAHFDSLSRSEQSAEGFQVQHLVAADQANWTVRMAWEVIRDAMTMARCNALLHIVSNVSTAVSYFNPDVELIFCAPEAQS
jgi:glycosyltransferase involved in cell wall biosynthesis